MKKKLIILIPVLLVVLGGVYKFVLATPKEAVAKPKVEGSVYILGKEFLVNLADNRFAKVTVGLLLDPHDTSAAPPETGGHGAAPKPPEGFGLMPQEAVVRDIITDELTGADAEELVDGDKREKLKKAVAKNILKHTDVHVEEILFTDVTVQ